MSQIDEPVDLDAYLHTYEQLQDSIEGLSAEQLCWKANDKTWSVAEVLTHLADHNIVVSFRIREILSGSTATLPAFAQDPWVAGQKANEGRVEDTLDLFRNLLQYNGRLFGRLTPEEWEKTGVNFKGETVTVSGIVRGFVKHVQGHLGQIDRIKRAESEHRNAGSSRAI